MVRRVINVIVGRISGLNQAAFWLAAFSAASLLLAFLRDRILTHNFGANQELDVYYAAFKIPDLLFVTIASLVSVSALVPIFAKKETEGEKHLKDASDSIFTVFSVAIILFSAIAWAIMPKLVPIVFSGFSDYMRSETILLSRILLLSPLLLGFSNFFGSIVQYEKRFILYSLSPLLYNIGIIFGLYFGLDDWGVKAAVAGVCIGAFLHLTLPALFVFFSPSRPRLTLTIKWKDVLETAYLSVPRTLALSISSIVGFIFVSVASLMQVGSIAVFNLSFNLQSALLSLIGVSFSLAAFPAIAVYAAENKVSEVAVRISAGLRQIIFWSLPATGLLIILRAHLVRIVLGSGVFDWSATRLTAAMLSLFAVSIVFQCFQLFLSRSHYALGKTALPLVGNFAGGVVSVLVALSLIKYFEFFSWLFMPISSALNISDLVLPVLVLPLAFSLGSLVSALILFFGLGRKMSGNVWTASRGALLHSFVAGLTGGFMAYLLLQFSDHLFDLEQFFGVLAHGFLAGIVGIAGAAIMYRLLNTKEYLELLVAIKDKFKK